MPAVLLLTLLLAAAPAAAREQNAAASARPLPADAAYTYTVAPFVQEYEPPAPGSYSLPVIDRVGNHAFVDSAGVPCRLAALTRERLAVVAFVYTSCAETSGCPLAEAILQRLDRRLADDAALGRRVRLITVSFDPERDTPGRMAQVREFYQPRTDWVFLTAPGPAELQPVLDDFGQPVAKLFYDDGTWTGLFRHVLKVFLLDEQLRVRNIYSTGLISPDLVLADLRTLVLEPH